MKYLVKATPPIDVANAADDKGGPGAVFEHLAKRFRPELMYGSAMRRQLVMIVDLDGAEDVAELMFVCGRSAECEPELTPLIDPQALIATLHRTDAAPRL